MRTLTTKTIAFLFALISISALFAQDPGLKPARNFQLSILPMLGTEGTDALHHRYHISINLFAGITGGVEGLELGGFLNLTNGEVEGLQLAGFGNIVNGNVQGLQGAGFMNIINGATRGVMGSGFMNVSRFGHEGVMGAGFMNVSGGNVSAVAGAGFMNVSRGDFRGVAGSGFMNVTDGSFEGVAGTGFMNVVRHDAEGMMAAGFANVIGGDVKGPQVAGFMNVSRNLEGFQASGFLNVAHHVKGAQFGFINVCDTIEGVPIGFLSVVKRGGFRQFELGATDALFFNASFRIGVNAFYNIFSVGYRPDNRNEFIGYGYGVGTQLRLADASFLNLEVNHTQLRRDWIWTDDDHNYLAEFRVLFAHNLTPRVQLFAGAVLNHQYFKLENGENAEDYSIAPRTFHEGSYRNWNTQWWLGARGGIRVNLH